MDYFLKTHRVSKPDMPLIAYQDLAVFKLFLLDVGLLSAMSQLDIRTVIEGNRIFTEFKGAQTEQYVMQELRVAEDIYIGYWTNERSTAEVDFIVQQQGLIFPIEVKAETNIKAKSFRLFCEKISTFKKLIEHHSKHFTPNHGWRICHYMQLVLSGNNTKRDKALITNTLSHKEFSTK